jgi:hypothetical protein
MDTGRFPTQHNFTKWLTNQTKEGKVIGYRPEAMQELTSFLDTCSFRRRRDEVRDDLPKLVYSSFSVELTAEQRRLYEKIKDQLILEIEQDERTGERTVFPNTVQLRLGQACFSPELYGGSKHSAKLDELHRIVEELVSNGEKAIIFSKWAKATRIMQRELAKYNPAYVDGSVKGADRNEQQDKFNNDPACHCVLPDTEVSIVGDLLGATRSWHEGEVIELVRRSGKKLTVTPNHPVLTNRGWIAAKFVCQGDKIFNGTSSKSLFVSGKAGIDFDKIPTRASDLYAAATISGVTSVITTSATSNDFHGDGKFRKGEVNIVSLASDLLPVSNFEVSQQLSELNLVDSNTSATSLSSKRLCFQFLQSSSGSQKVLTTRAQINSHLSHSLTKTLSRKFTFVGQAFYQQGSPNLEQSKG